MIANSVRDQAVGAWSAASRFAVVLLLLVGIFVYFSVSQPDFLSQANIENLLNKRYYASAHSNNNILPGSPRALRVTLNAKF